MAVSGQVVARRLPVLGSVNAGKAATLAAMGAELDRVRAGVWARFSGVKAAALSKRQIRDRLMAGQVWLALMTPARGKRLRLNLGPLPSELVPTSTIAISPDGRDRWQVIAAYSAKRVCSTRPQHKKLARIEGIDAGVSEVFTDTAGHRYGAGQYQRIAARAERDRARGKARNKLRAVRDRHLARAAVADAACDTVTACRARATAARIERHNLGRTKLSAQRAHDRAATKDAVYQAVHDLVDTTAHIVAEDLSGLRGKSKFGTTSFPSNQQRARSE